MASKSIKQGYTGQVPGKQGKVMPHPKETKCPVPGPVFKDSVIAGKGNKRGY